MSDKTAIKESLLRVVELSAANSKELTRDGLLSSLAPTIEKFSPISVRMDTGGILWRQTRRSAQNSSF